MIALDAEVFLKQLLDKEKSFRDFAAKQPHASTEHAIRAIAIADAIAAIAHAVEQYIEEVSQPA